jgi:hypothetical protein
MTILKKLGYKYDMYIYLFLYIFMHIFFKIFQTYVNLRAIIDNKVHPLQLNGR